MNKRLILVLSTTAALAVPRLAAKQDLSSSGSSFADKWDAKVRAARESQPIWITPLATTTPRLEQEFRYDQNRQSLEKGSTVDLYDGRKGLELIPTEQTELIISARRTR